METPPPAPLCCLCGRFVFEIPGVAEWLAPYRVLYALWRERPQPLNGVFHFSCIRTFPHRELHQDIVDLFTTGDRIIEVELDGEMHQIPRPGFGSIERAFSGETCDVYGGPRMESWLVLEHDGPWFFVDLENMAALRQGRRPEITPGVGKVILPFDFPSVGSLSLPEILERTGVLDLYEEPLRECGIKYEFWDYYPPKRILEYSVTGYLPVPQEAINFLRGYELGPRVVRWMNHRYPPPAEQE